MTHDCSFLEALALADDQLSFAMGRREPRAADWGTQDSDEAVVPDAVVWPESTDDVSAVLAAATDHGVPVTPFAAGTGLEGNAVPAHGGISLDLTRMDDVIEYRPEDFQIDVGPGIIGTDVDEYVADDGLFFPPLPSSGDISTVGGMVATDASGMKTVKYGEIADWVLGLEAVLADGTVIETGSRAVKTSSGYNLTELLIGSEGTLGVVTRVTLRLAGRPEQIRGGRAIFETLEDATEAISDAIRTEVDVARIELVDELSAGMANDYLGTDLPDAPMVFLEFHANHGVDEEIDLCRTIFEGHDVSRFEMSDDDAEMERLWKARRELAYAVRSYDPDLEPLHPGDVTVPISAYPKVVREAKRLGEQRDLLVPCFGHAGDGNVHYSVLVDPDDPEMVDRGERLYRDLVELALEFGGTATGEHGIGLGKRRFLEPEHGAGAVETMRAIKRALDPTDTLNPGKLFPETLEGERVRERGPTDGD
ncbi:FAD-binding oxidoreductase [Natrarchaeobaculum sulfurireducens]|uniref:D-lactate dehydrogenase (cytochrome) n=1 Tax=Natrarchaeobaculum sulfurireducens TaxID=2044521 RepID=A0A346PRA9_9EURY|nr:FAD-linked oxidase C-terminal domain-containing protein [Natrarchaeobaculum sulfurireducens]AXR82054.1 D-Lactate dehydrogenase, cytochrome c-dependent [Natrarchaeobaculum sulfurireducens]